MLRFKFFVIWLEHIRSSYLIEFLNIIVDKIHRGGGRAPCKSFNSLQLLGRKK